MSVSRRYWRPSRRPKLATTLSWLRSAPVKAPCDDSREARALTQSTVAELLDMDQSEVSRLEHRSDMLLSTLKRFVQATGGELHLVVQYPDGGPVELLVDAD